MGPEHLRKLTHEHHFDPEIMILCENVKHYNGSERTVMEGVVPGRRNRGRPMWWWAQDIQETLGMKDHEAEDRQPVDCLLGRL